MSDTAVRTKRSAKAAMGPFGQVGKAVGELDERLGVAKGGRVFLDKIFPDHWSFMLGEISLYSFVVLLATGVFLSLFFVPSTNQVIYHGSYAPLRGQWMSAAYKSTVDISFDVRGGLLVRQMHHWAADIFTGSIVVHMARIFFTGAFRKPARAQLDHRPHDADPGHLRGLHRVLAARRPHLGHRAAHRLLHRRVDPAGRELPGLVPLGRALPGRHHHPPLLHHPRADHPPGPDRAPLGAPGPAGPPEAHAVRRGRAHGGQRGGLAHVPDLHGQDHRVPLHGDGGDCAARGVRPDQPHLAVRVLRRVEDLLRGAARLVHGLARRRPADHGRRGSSRRSGTPSPSRSSCPQSSSPASSSRSVTCGPGSNDG